MVPIDSGTWIRPPALRPGDSIGIVAPASNIQADLFAEGCRELESLGFRVRFREDIHSLHRYLAGSLARRSDEFHQMMLDRDTQGVFCARGGYGSAHLLPRLDFEALRAQPKVFCGASDITMLLGALESRGLVVFHGPMVATTIRQGPAGYDREVLERLLMLGEAVTFPTGGCEILATGRGEGRLTGGCLSLVVSLLGTPWEVSTRGTIMVLEDIGCRPYQIDRMLTQLRQAGKFDRVEGFVFGEMLDCTQHEDQDYSLQDIIRDVVGDLGVPILYNFPTGHSTRPNVVVPFGVAARLELDASTDPPSCHFRLLEPAVTMPR
jgi:muramoyltetrapeptide carboxypeptidase